MEGVSIGESLESVSGGGVTRASVMVLEGYPSTRPSFRPLLCPFQPFPPSPSVLSSCGFCVGQFSGFDEGILPGCEEGVALTLFVSVCKGWEDVPGGVLSWALLCVLVHWAVVGPMGPCPAPPTNVRCWRDLRVGASSL